MGKWHFWLSMIFFNVDVLSDALPGPGGHARRVPDYATQFADWNMVATIGAFGFGLSQLLLLYNVLTCIRSGAPAPAKPWEGLIRWSGRLPSPVPYHTFETPARHRVARKGSRTWTRGCDATPAPEQRPIAARARRAARGEPAHRAGFGFDRRGILRRRHRWRSTPARRCGHRCPRLRHRRLSGRGDRQETCAAKAIDEWRMNELANGSEMNAQTNEQGNGREIADSRRSNRSLLKRLVVVAVVMFGFEFALIPFYNKICEVTGLRNIAIADEVSTPRSTARAWYASSSTAT